MFWKIKFNHRIGWFNYEDQRHLISLLQRNRHDIPCMVSQFRLPKECQLNVGDQWTSQGFSFNVHEQSETLPDNIDVEMTEYIVDIWKIKLNGTITEFAYNWEMNYLIENNVAISPMFPMTRPYPGLKYDLPDTKDRYEFLQLLKA